MRNKLASSFDGKGGYLDNIYYKNANEYKNVKLYMKKFNLNSGCKRLS